MSMEPTISDLIDWAKDRVLDDLKELVLDCPSPSMFWASGNNIKKYREMTGKMRKMVGLLRLPNHKVSLAKLQKANYWNGWDDTFFESSPAPRDPKDRKFVDYRKEKK